MAIYQHLLTGLNVIEPLFSYVQANVAVPDAEGCRPVKEMVIELCMKVCMKLCMKEARNCTAVAPPMPVALISSRNCWQIGKSCV